jgi:hypothetical protein
MKATPVIGLEFPGKASVLAMLCELLHGLHIVPAQTDAY